MKNLKILRLQNDLTQEQLAKELNMPRTKYARYELNTSQPNIETLIKLANFYHTTVDAILGHEVPYLLDKSTLTQEQRELLEDIKNLSPENCKRVKDFITGILIAEEEKQKLIDLYKRGN